MRNICFLTLITLRDLRFVPYLLSLQMILKKTVFPHDFSLLLTSSMDTLYIFINIRERVFIIEGNLKYKIYRKNI